MDANELISILQTATLDPDTNTRRNAEAQLNEVSKSPGFFPALIGLALQMIQSNDEAQSHAVLLCATYVKNEIKSDWDKRKERKISPEDRNALRPLIFNCLLQSPRSLRSLFSVSLTTIVRHDFPSQWPSLAEELAMNMNSDNVAQLIPVLTALRVVIKSFQFCFDRQQRAPIDSLISQCLPRVFGLLQQAMNGDDEVSATIMLLCIQIFFHSIAVNISPCICQAAVITSWMEAFFIMLSRPIPPSDIEMNQNPHWKIKKWILQVFQRLFSVLRMPKSDFEKGDYLRPFGISFNQSFREKMFDVSLTLLSACTDKSQWPKKTLTLLVRFVNEGLNISKIYKKMKPAFKTLLETVLFPMVFLAADDAAMFDDDPYEYVRSDSMEMEDFFSPRYAALKLIGEMCVLRSSVHYKQVLTLCLSLLESHASQPNPLAVDACFMIIGGLHHSITSILSAEQLHSLFQQRLLPELSSASGIVRARACWLFARFPTEIYSSQFLMAGSQRLIQLLEDPCLPVRLYAAIALSEVCSDEEIRVNLQPILTQVVQVYFSLMKEVENEDLVGALKTLISLNQRELAPVAAELAGALMQQLAQYSQDADDDQMVLAAAECVMTLRSVLNACMEADDPNVMAQVVEAVLPIYLLLDPEREIAFDTRIDVMTIFSYLTGFTLNLIPSLWTAWPAIIDTAIHMDEMYVSESFLPIHHFITKDPLTLINDPQKIEPLLALIRHCFDSETSSAFSRLTAHKLLESLILAAPGKIGNLIPQLLQATFSNPPLSDPLPTLSHFYSPMKVIAATLFTHRDAAVASLSTLNVTCSSALLSGNWSQLSAATSGSSTSSSTASTTTTGMALFCQLCLQLPLSALQAMHTKKVLVLGVSSLLLKCSFQELPPALQEAALPFIAKLIEWCEEINQQIHEELNREDAMFSDEVGDGDFFNELDEDFDGDFDDFEAEEVGEGLAEEPQEGQESSRKGRRRRRRRRRKKKDPEADIGSINAKALAETQLTVTQRVDDEQDVVDFINNQQVADLLQGFDEFNPDDELMEEDVDEYEAIITAIDDIDEVVFFVQCIHEWDGTAQLAPHFTEEMRRSMQELEQNAKDVLEKERQAELEKIEK